MREKYQYTTTADLLTELKASFLSDWIKPISQSYSKDKFTFVLQSINFVLIFIFIKQFITPLSELLFNHASGSAVFGLNIISTLLVILLFSSFQNNKVLKWQTIFNTGRDLTKTCIKLFITLDICSYLGFQYYASKYKK